MGSSSRSAFAYGSSKFRPLNQGVYQARQAMPIEQTPGCFPENGVLLIVRSTGCTKGFRIRTGARMLCKDTDIVCRVPVVDARRTFLNCRLKRPPFFPFQLRSSTPYEAQRTCGEQNNGTGVLRAEEPLPYRSFIAFRLVPGIHTVRNSLRRFDVRMLLPALELGLGTPTRLSMCNVVFGAKFPFYMVISRFPVQLLAHQSIYSLSFDVPGASAPSGPSGPSLPTKLSAKLQ